MKDTFTCKRCGYRQFVKAPCYACGNFEVVETDFESTEMLEALDDLMKRLDEAAKTPA